MKKKIVSLLIVVVMLFSYADFGHASFNSEINSNDSWDELCSRIEFYADMSMFFNQNTDAATILYNFLVNPYPAGLMSGYYNESEINYYNPGEHMGAGELKGLFLVTVYNGNKTDEIAQKFFDITDEEIKQIHDSKSIYWIDEDNAAYYDQEKYYVYSRYALGFGDPLCNMYDYEILKKLDNNKYYMRFLIEDYIDGNTSTYYGIVQKIDDRKDGYWKIYTLQNTPIDVITVILNGEEIEFDQPPVMINDRVMVPIRAVAEKMGDTVKWSNYLNSALIVHADRMVIFKNNSEQALIYTDITDSSTWSSYYCDVPPQVINNRTLTPVRAIGECLGAKVDWDGNTQTVIINYDKNTPHTLKDNAFTQLNAYYSSLLQASDFTTYSDEINEFYNSRSNWADAFIIFWDDWTISLDILASGEKTNVYMLKNCFAEILSEIPDSDVKDFDVYTEILDWLSKTSKLADIDFTKVDKVVNISVQTANSLSKFGNAIDKAGTALDFTGVGIDVLAELLSDYSTGMLYIDTLRNSFKNSGIQDEVIYTALDELENDYVNKCANTLIENATSMSSSALLKLITSGAFNVASFGKDILNWVVDNDDKADAVKNINCIYLFNECIDKAYSDVRNNLIADPTEIDDYIRLFNFQKIVKTKMYESMDRLRKKSDQYTQIRITEQLDKLKKSSYIIWE